MFFLRIVSVELVILGIMNIYGFISTCGAPATPLEYLRAVFAASVVFIALGLGLFSPLPIMRTLGLGVFYTCLLTAAYFQITWFMGEGFTPPAFLLGILQSQQSLLEQLASNKNMGIAALVTGWALLIVPAALLQTPDLKQFYGDDAWFRRPLTLRGFDLKPWIVALVVGVLFNFDAWLPQKHSSVAACGSLSQVPGKIAPNIPKPLPVHKDPNQKKWDEDRERTSFAAFSGNNTSLWVVLSVGKLVHYNLTNYKSKVFEFAKYQPGSEDFLSRDGKYFYSPLARQVFSVESEAALNLPLFSSERVFLGFAKNSTYLVYVKAQHKLQLHDAEKGSMVFEIPMALTLKHEDVRWNPDRTLMFFRISDVAFQFVNAISGKTLVQNLALRTPEHVFDDSKLGAVIVSGPVAYNKEFKSYKVDPATLMAQELPTNKKLLGVDPFSGTYLSGERLSFQFLEKINFQEDNPLKIDFREVVVVPKLGSLVIIEDASPYLQLFDLQTGIKTQLTSAYATGRPVDENNCVITGSPDGQLLFTSCWKQAEVFWVSTFAGQKIQSWKFNLPFEPPPVSSPQPGGAGKSKAQADK